MNKDISNELPALPERRRMTNMALVTQSLQLQVDQAHRMVAQESVPSHVIVPTGAVISQVVKDGRVTGVWVEARVFVSLAVEQ